MPRVYIADPRGKIYRRRNEDNLNAAAEEYKNISLLLCFKVNFII